MAIVALEGAGGSVLCGEELGFRNSSELGLWK